MSSENQTGAPAEASSSEVDVTRLTQEAVLSVMLEMLRTQDTETGAPDPSEQPPNWLEENIGATSLWNATADYENCKFCLNCLVTVTMLVGDYEKRDTPNFKHKHMREVNTLYHIDPTKMMDDYTPLDILDGAVQGCPLCAMAVATTWFRGDMPFDTARWAKNPLWRKRAQYFLFNLYRPDRPWHGNMPRALCQLVYGTKLTTELYPEADMSEFWGAIHFWEREDLNKWYDNNSYPYTLKDTLGPAPLPPVAPTTGDLETLNVGTWWLKRCLGEHSSCKAVSKNGSGAQRPTRLLFVGDARDPNTVKLVMDEELPDSNKPEYVTLSYCWGKKPFTQLTEKSLADMRKSVDIDALPATLRDAITISRHLGFSYIWIDALCILQDSKSDWLTESAKMGSIYRGSVLTIAALGAADVFQGCFAPRNPLCYQDLHLGKSSIVLSNRAPPTMPGFKREFEVSGPAASPLQTRAWCVQEELLSSRTLFFGAAGLFWQCIECEADEGYPVGTKSSNQSGNLKADISKALAGGDFNLRDLWRKVLERYTGCKLTYASDKLVAVSGISNLLQGAKSTKYNLGLWDDDEMWRDLLWHSREPQWINNHKLERLNNGCPSFSWASVAQAIHYFKYDHPGKTHLEAKSISLEPTAAATTTTITAPAGGVPPYRLRLTTQLTEVVLLPPAYSKTGCPQIMVAADLAPDAEIEWEDPQLPNEIVIRLLRPTRLDWTIDREVDEDVEALQTGGFLYDWTPDITLDGSITRAWFVCLARHTGLDPLGAVGLIVVPVDEQRTMWKRIGFLSHGGFPESWKSGDLRATVQATETNEIDWEETAKHRSRNPFLLDPERECAQVVLV